MKKIVLAYLFLAMLLLVSCGYSTGAPGINEASSAFARDEMSMAYTPASSETRENEVHEYALTDSGGRSDMPDAVTSVSIGVQTNVSLAEKIIYSASANIETIQFDETLTGLSEMIASYGAFIENSYESGIDYASKHFGYNAYRSANFVIRIPRENFSAFTGALTGLGNVTSLSTNATNVTEQYTDVESRLTVYRTEESRLLAMLEKCDTVADMITIESTLSSVRYEIEFLTSRLKNLDNQVNYSSVTLNIYEVEELSPAAKTHLTYGQQLSNGLKNTLEDIGSFFKEALKFVIINSPVFAIFALMIIVAVIVIRRFGKRTKPAETNLPPHDTKD